jgi:hypothetical protein
VPPPPALPSPPVTGGLIVPGSEVSRIAIANDGKTIYALDTRGGRLFKSLAAGTGWLNLSGNLPGGPGWYELAVAPDDPQLVAAATDGGREVWLSADGGNTFNLSGLAGRLAPGECVTALDISPAFNGKRDILAGTATGDARGRVWAIALSRLAPAWVDISSGAPGWPAPAGADIFALRCSPGYAADGAILAVTASSHTQLFLAERNQASGAVKWNQLPGFPVEIGEASTGTPLAVASLALPADYAPAQPGYNRVYACWSRGTEGDAYRIDGNRCTRLNVGEPVASLAFFGTARQGRLLAGAAAASPSFHAVQVYLSTNPTSTLPDWQPAAKAPTGQAEARLAWSPDGKLAFCGTRGNFSAFSLSADDGYSWNQVGLISS